MKSEYKNFQIKTLKDAEDGFIYAEIVDLDTSCICQEVGPAQNEDAAMDMAKVWCDRVHKLIARALAVKAVMDM